MKKPKKTKPKIGIWTRIKNIYNDSPWHAAFTYPIIYVVFLILLLFVPYTPIIGLILIFILLAPLWVFLGLFISKKKTPFVLSLFTGLIVVPMLIATFAFQGFEGSAKTNATKTMHAQTVKYISAEIQKCKIGESKFMSNNQDCPATALKAINGAVATMTDVNPFESEKLSIRLSNSNTTDEDVGFINLSASGSNIIIKTCIKTPCKKEENRLQDSIGIK